MTLFDILFSWHFISSVIIHGILVLIGMPMLDYLQQKLGHPLLDILWENVTIPLFRALLIIIFIFLSYPVIFGLLEAPTISELLATGENRINNAVNVVFIIRLFFPLIPVFGKQIEFILPLQAIACSGMVFSWYVEAVQPSNYSYWPGFSTIIMILAAAIVTHYIAIKISLFLGALVDKRFHVTGSNELVARSVILFMQTPAILLYCLSLGKQIVI